MSRGIAGSLATADPARLRGGHRIALERLGDPAVEQARSRDGARPESAADEVGRLDRPSLARVDGLEEGELLAQR